MNKMIVFFGILFLFQRLLVLKNKQFGLEEGNRGLQGIVKGKLALVFGNFFYRIVFNNREFYRLNEFQRHMTEPELVWVTVCVPGI